jgi:hypothetical protein
MVSAEEKLCAVYEVPQDGFPTAHEISHSPMRFQY